MALDRNAASSSIANSLPASAGACWSSSSSRRSTISPLPAPGVAAGSRVGHSATERSWVGWLQGRSLVIAALTGAAQTVQYDSLAPLHNSSDAAPNAKPRPGSASPHRSDLTRPALGRECSEDDVPVPTAPGAAGVHAARCSKKPGFARSFRLAHVPDSRVGTPAYKRLAPAPPGVRPPDGAPLRDAVWGWHAPCLSTVHVSHHHASELAQRCARVGSTARSLPSAAR